MYIVYLAIHRLVLSIFGLFRDFAPILMYWENEKKRVIPTVLPDNENRPPSLKNCWTINCESNLPGLTRIRIRRPLKTRSQSQISFFFAIDKFERFDTMTVNNCSKSRGVT